MTRNPHLAHAVKVNTKNGTRTDTAASSYPEIPSWWPSRAIRRAVKLGREARLPAAWVRFLAVNPDLRKQIKAL